MRRVLLVVLIACLQGLSVAWASDTCQGALPMQTDTAQATSVELRGLAMAPQIHHCDHLGAHLASVPAGTNEQPLPFSRTAGVLEEPAPVSPAYAPLPPPPKA